MRPTDGFGQRARHTHHTHGDETLVSRSHHPPLLPGLLRRKDHDRGNRRRFRQPRTVVPAVQRCQAIRNRGLPSGPRHPTLLRQRVHPGGADPMVAGNTKKDGPERALELLLPGDVVEFARTVDGPLLLVSTMALTEIPHAGQQPYWTQSLQAPTTCSDSASPTPFPGPAQLTRSESSRTARCSRGSRLCVASLRVGMRRLLRGVPRYQESRRRRGALMIIFAISLIPPMAPSATDVRLFRHARTGRVLAMKAPASDRPGRCIGVSEAERDDVLRASSVQESLKGHPAAGIEKAP